MPGKGNPQLASIIGRMIQRNGQIDIPSSGKSMMPLIREGNVCRFVAVQISELRRGDILLYAAEDGELVGHRLIRVEEQDGEKRFICKGDSNLRPDPPLLPNRVLGKLVSVKKARYTIEVGKGIAWWWGQWLVHMPWLSWFIRLGLHASAKAGRHRKWMQAESKW